MVSYPVHVSRDMYRGSNPRLQEKARTRNHHAALIESGANALIQNQKDAIHVYGWSEISRASGLPIEVVEELGFSIDCGSSGFTATRPGLSQAQIERALNGEQV